MQQKALALTFAFLILFQSALPCGWDLDTIQMEKEEFPTVHELITGKFLKHSQALYFWRVKDRQEKLILYPDSLGLLDDLGVAYDKIGEHESAIATMLRKEEQAPGLYETAANLGTFYIHNGELETGLTWIKKAIEINPDAHFGREVFQQHLVSYLIERKVERSTLPLGTRNANFYHYLLRIHAPMQDKEQRKEELSKAIKGIAGMMQFGQHNSPVLLEALGDLLSNVTSGFQHAGHLAARAYLKASFTATTSESVAAYKKRARYSREKSYADHDRVNGRIEAGSYSIKTEELEKALQFEVMAGKAFTDSIEADEMAWIKAGINPDSAFAAKYYQSPVSKPVSKHYVRKHGDEVEELAWLNQQLEDPKQIMNIHLVRKLDQATRDTIAMLYANEFSTLDTAQAIPMETAQPATVENEDGISISKVWLFLGAVIAIGGFLIFRDYRKNKEEDAE